jgi:hypothetical protein
MGLGRRRQLAPPVIHSLRGVLALALVTVAHSLALPTPGTASAQARTAEW